MKKFYLLSFLFFASVQYSLAQTQTSTGNTGNGGQTSNGNTGNGTSAFSESSFLRSPLKSKSIVELFSDILDVIMVIATPIIVVFIILAGFKFVTAQGDTFKLKEAKDSLINAIIGGVLILGAKLILMIIQNTIDEF